MEEHQKGPSGVVTIVKNKIINWNHDDNIIILLNKNHWAYNQLRLIKRKKYKIIKLNFKNSNEIKIKVKNILNNKILYSVFRVLFFPFEILLNLKLIFFLKKIIKKNSIQVILSHNGGWPGGILNRLIFYLSKKIKKILIIHNFPAKNNFINSVFLKFNELLINYLNIEIITVSKACKKSLKENSLFKRIKIIHNGIEELNKNKNTLNKKIFSKRIKIFFLGKIESRKGLDILIQAANKIKKNFDIYIYGNGEKKYINYLKNLKNVNNYNLIFKKAEPDVVKILENCEIVIMPSRSYESFGMTLVEAMRQKKAVICSNVGGMTEIVKTKRNGFVFKKNDTDDLKKKLESLIVSKKLRTKFGYEGYKTYIKKFSNKIFLKKYYRLVYEK